MLGLHLSEYHTGYRAYSRQFLEAIPFLENSNDFVFDTQVLIQAATFGFRIGEVPAIPRLYTDGDLERLDVILTLARDMGVNLAGIEIILNMREKMVEMERQMTEFATVVQQELARVASLRGEPAPRNAIVRAVPPRSVRMNIRES